MTAFIYKLFKPSNLAVENGKTESSAIRDEDVRDRAFPEELELKDERQLHTDSWSNKSSRSYELPLPSSCSNSQNSSPLVEASTLNLGKPPGSNGGASSLITPVSHLQCFSDPDLTQQKTCKRQRSSTISTMLNRGFLPFLHASKSKSPSRPGLMHYIPLDLKIPDILDTDSSSSYLTRVLDFDFGNAVIILAAKKSNLREEALQDLMQRLDFDNMPLDLSLRKLLLTFRVGGETQCIDRILSAFASRYHQQNTHLCGSFESTFYLAYALLLLHTDIYNANNKTKMSRDQWISITQGHQAPFSVLTYFYDNICFERFASLDSDRRSSSSITNLIYHVRLFCYIALIFKELYNDLRPSLPPRLCQPSDLTIDLPLLEPFSQKKLVGSKVILHRPATRRLGMVASRAVNRESDLHLTPSELVITEVSGPSLSLSSLRLWDPLLHPKITYSLENLVALEFLPDSDDCDCHGLQIFRNNKISSDVLLFNTSQQRDAWLHQINSTATHCNDDTSYTIQTHTSNLTAYQSELDYLHLLVPFSTSTREAVVTRATYLMSRAIHLRAQITRFKWQTVSPHTVVSRLAIPFAK